MSDDVMTEADYDALIEKADKKTLWWALFRLLNALGAARYQDPACQGQPDARGGLYNVAHFTADHWAPQIEGMPTAVDIARECRADDEYHRTHTS